MRARIVGLIAIIAAFGVWPTGQAEAQGRGVVIQNIVVEGTRRIDPQTIGTYLKVRVGDRFDQGKLDDSLKALFASGLFRDVSFRREGGTLVIRIVENPVINRIVLEGNKRLKDDKIENLRSFSELLFPSAASSSSWGGVHPSGTFPGSVNTHAKYDHRTMRMRTW